jgi:hypothetical protein
MTHLTSPIADALREAARETDGRFGIHERTAPEATLPVSTYSIPVDEINEGDTLLIDGAQHPVHESYVLGTDPGMRVVATDNDYIRLDRETRVSIVRTGDEPDPKDADGYAGDCDECGEAFASSYDNTASHIHLRVGNDYDANAQDTPYSRESLAKSARRTRRRYTSSADAG